MRLTYRTLIVLALPVIALLIAAGCTQPAHNAPTAPAGDVTPIATVANLFVGSEACAKCHAAEWKSHSKTHHAHTFRPMTVAALGSIAPPQTLFTDTNCAVAIQDGAYVLANPRTGQTRPLHYALGSGKQGLTFIAMEAGDTVFEMRKSYIPRTKEWYATPGQELENANPNATGRRWSREISRKCVGCHSVTLSEYRSYPDPQFMGVGCESCHGPGGAHIAAVNSGKTDLKDLRALKMEDLKGVGGKRINAICSACHRSAEDVAAMPAKERLTQRFMVYGLSQSRCFQGSADRLSCISCHNPHEDASSDHKTYERVCLSCHAPAATTLASAPSGAAGPPDAARRVCPVNPRSGCIPCHMPTKRLSGKGNKIPIAMADHWIRVQRP